MENEIMVNEELNMETDLEYVDLDNRRSGNGLKLAVGLGLGAAVVGGLAYKFKGKLEERKIERLRKKGYVIFKEDECEVREVEEDVEPETEDESK